jgi:hypothetical protein
MPAKMVLTEATVAPNGSLIPAASPNLPFKPGEKVMLTITALPEIDPENPYPLRGTVLHYEDPFGAATSRK